MVFLFKEQAQGTKGLVAVPDRTPDRGLDLPVSVPWGTPTRGKDFSEVGDHGDSVSGPGRNFEKEAIEGKGRGETIRLETPSADGEHCVVPHPIVHRGGRGKEPAGQ
jgi:hypothetical protein